MAEMKIGFVTFNPGSGDGDQTANTVITQTAGDPFLEIDKEVINLDANGTPQTINVNSNIRWTITQAVSKLVRKVMK